MSESVNSMRWVGLTIIMVSCAVNCPAELAVSGALKLREGSQGPWWMQQTAMTSDGRLDLQGKTWWDQAAKLKLGEQLVIEAAGEAKGRILVRRERFQTRSGKEGEGIIWIIDDNRDKQDIVIRIIVIGFYIDNF